jgi:putative N6-adenine-specific DNA methylase
MDSYYVVVAPGLEPFALGEMDELGLRSNDSASRSIPVGKRPLWVSRDFERGGISFKGERIDLYRANLYLRTASRILVRVGNFFRAETFPELEERASRLPWERFLRPGQPISMRVTCHKSKLYHTDAVARTVMEGLGRRLGAASDLVKASEEGDDEQPAQLVIVRIVEDRCTASLDSSGIPLHKRGYRQALAKAPLRETLAAGMLLASGWDRRSPLLDPFCGSGTIPIEAALLAAGLPPGLHRRFAFMDWPDFDSVLWETILEQVHPMVSQRPAILASDRDAGAIAMARANAERAGVLDWIEFEQRAISAIAPPVGPGWVVTNPPYGERVSPGKDLRDLYARFGDVLRQACPGWTVAVLCSDPVLLGQMQMELDQSIRLSNGGISVRLARGNVGA